MAYWQKMLGDVNEGKYLNNIFIYFLKTTYGFYYIGKVHKQTITDSYKDKIRDDRQPYSYSEEGTERWLRKLDYIQTN